VVAAFWCWCEAQCQRHDLLPSNPLTKALKYAMARSDQPKEFLSDPDVPIDTNHLERALRPISVQPGAERSGRSDRSTINDTPT